MKYPNRCGECQTHGEDIDSRGDCKTLLSANKQCLCYSKEHKANFFDRPVKTARQEE